MQKNIVGIVFSRAGKRYNFDAGNIPDIRVGDMVVVNTTKGRQIGTVASIMGDQQNEGKLKQVDRRATPGDLLIRQKLQQREIEAVKECRQKISELGISGIKVIDAEFSFDESKVRILVSSEVEEKVDVRRLKKTFQDIFNSARLEVRQVGPRDTAKIICGMGACGLEERCCSRFITEFSSISIRMAKDQGISLTPAEITGMCGRLRCCLTYEHHQYADARKMLPKRNKMVHTPAGEGKVVDVLPLRLAALVDVPGIGVREFSSEEISLVDHKVGRSEEGGRRGEGVSNKITDEQSRKTRRQRGSKRSGSRKS